MPLPDAKINIVLSFIYEKENFMTEQTKCNFLRKRMSELRKANNKSLSDMAELIGCDKSALSRAEKIDGTTKYKTIRDFAEEFVCADAISCCCRYKTIKAVKRAILKWKFPVGTVVTCTGKYIDDTYKFIVL